MGVRQAKILEARGARAGSQPPPDHRDGQCRPAPSMLWWLGQKPPPQQSPSFISLQATPCHFCAPYTQSQFLCLVTLALCSAKRLRKWDLYTWTDPFIKGDDHMGSPHQATWGECHPTVANLSASSRPLCPLRGHPVTSARGGQCFPC